jgi:membrane protease YdiL (CAAX protease family)
MNNVGSTGQEFFFFLVAYFVFFLFSFKADPRFSLKYKKPPSYQHLFFISTVGTVVMLSVLVLLNLIFSRDLVSVFNLNSLYFSWHDILLGLLACLAIFIFIMPMEALISSVRRKFFNSYKSRREDDVKKLILASFPKSQTRMFILLTITSLKAAIFEEIIFRGYLLGSLLLWVSPVIAIIVSAVLFFAGHLYQGIFPSFLPFFGGLAFGLAFFLTRSLTVVIVAHFVGDMIGLTIQAIVMSKKNKD